MWRQNRSYDEIISDLRSRRSIVDPNVGFLCALMEFRPHDPKPVLFSEMNLWKIWEFPGRSNALAITPQDKSMHQIHKEVAILRKCVGILFFCD